MTALTRFGEPCATCACCETPLSTEERIDRDGDRVRQRCEHCALRDCRRDGSEHSACAAERAEEQRGAA